MPDSHAVMTTLDEVPLERRVAREAAGWLVRLGSGQASAADVRACERWRACHEEHERAWQRAQSLHQAFGTLPAHVGMATLGRARQPGRRAVLKAVLGVAVAPTAAWTLWRSDATQAWRAPWRTVAGERREVRLADGTRLHLNTATALDATDDALRLYHGEIHVETAAGPGSLRVRTPLGDVVARQAAFTVHLHDGRCTVASLRGTLVLCPAHGSVRELAPRQQAWFDRQAAHLETAPSAQAPDWLRGMLHARDMRLDAFAAELARYRPGVVQVDPAVGHLRVSGAFALDHTQIALDALPTLLPVQIRYRTPWWVSIVPVTI